MSNSNSIELQYTGTYSLGTSVTFAAEAAFIRPVLQQSAGAEAVFDLAVLIDGSWAPVGVRLEQRGEHLTARVAVNLEQIPNDDVRAQLERMLSLDVDGVPLASIAARDSEAADLINRFPGVRPVLYASPYEAAAKAIIMHRISRRQAASIASRLSEDHGSVLERDGNTMYAFPAPKKLAALSTVPGLSERKIEQLRLLGVAVQDSDFTAAHLRSMTPGDSQAYLQQLAGIGPFSAELIQIRGVGDADFFPRTELSLHRSMATAYHLGEDPALDVLESRAEQWRPYRSWIGLLFRHLAEGAPT